MTRLRLPGGNLTKTITQSMSSIMAETIPTEPLSNLRHWQEMQRRGYFDHHPHYQNDEGSEGHECSIVEWFTPLRSDMDIVVIGVGYGRETAHLARRVRSVYGIDVSDLILDKARCYLADRGVTNFVPLLAESYRAYLPSSIDLVFSLAVMQHLTRDLVRDYLGGLGGNLSQSGKMVIQFLETDTADFTADAEDRVYEPSVSWSIWQIVQAARDSGLKLEQSRSYLVTPAALWHWACLSRA